MEKGIKKERKEESMKEVERNRVGERWKRAWKGYHCLLKWEAGHRIIDS